MVAVSTLESFGSNDGFVAAAIAITAARRVVKAGGSSQVVMERNGVPTASEVGAAGNHALVGN